MLGWFVLSFIVVNFTVGMYTFFRYDYRDYSCLNLIFCSFSGIISFLMVNKIRKDIEHYTLVDTLCKYTSYSNKKEYNELNINRLRKLIKKYKSESDYKRLKTASDDSYRKSVSNFVNKHR